MLCRSYGCGNGYRPKPSVGGEGDEPFVWDDIPLIKYEAELLTNTGAWKSIEEMEENLILHEMFLLYRASAYHFNQQVKGSAAAFGSEVDWDDDWYDPAPPKQKQAVQMFDIAQMSIGLGYEKG